MASFAIAGEVGAGKTFCVVNHLMADLLRNSDRPVYTNLPCDGEELEYYLAWLFKSPALRESARKRLHFLYPQDKEAFEFKWVEVTWLSRSGEALPLESWPRNEEKAQALGLSRVTKDLSWPEDDDCLSEYRKSPRFRFVRQSLGLHHTIREFWLFVEPNSAVFLDESADEFNALGSVDESGKKEKGARRVLQSFINHHRHYLIDLYFIAQALDDIDVQVRRKFSHVYYIQNMKSEPMFQHWSLRGLCWPVQHFRVRYYKARKVLSKGLDFDRFEPLYAFRVWPSRRRYKNYRSLSQAHTVKGLKAPKRGARSHDMDTPWDRVKVFFAGAYMPLSVLGGIGVAVYLGIQFLFTLASADSDNVGALMGTGKNPKTNEVASAITTKTNQMGTNVYYSSAYSRTNSEGVSKPEKLLLVSGRVARTNLRWLRVGDELPEFGRVERICNDGIICGGVGVSWSLLFSSQPGASTGPGSSNL